MHTDRSAHPSHLIAEGSATDRLICSSPTYLIREILDSKSDQKLDQIERTRKSPRDLLAAGLERVASPSRAELVSEHIMNISRHVHGWKRVGFGSYGRHVSVTLDFNNH
jgi:hypothetical protein